VDEPVEVISSDTLSSACDPRLQRLYKYWRSLHPSGGGLPGRQHFDPLDLSELLRWLWLVDIQREPLRFRYRLIGTGHVQALSHDYTGQWLDEAHDGFSDMISYDAFVAVAGGAIRYCRRTPQFRLAKDYALFERVLLPLARDGAQVDMLLGISVYTRTDGTAV
jgi:hypothetical protein